MYCLVIDLKSARKKSGNIALKKCPHDILDNNILEKMASGLLDNSVENMVSDFYIGFFSLRGNTEE